MRIIYCVDENYIKYTELSIESVLKHNPTAEITIVSLKPLKIGNYENIVIPIERDFRVKNDHDRITKSAYLKCYLTQLPYDKIIFLDGDVICQAPLDDLWNMPCEYINICQTYTTNQAQALGLKRYALSGMMVMNLKNLRKIDFTEKCLEVERTFVGDWQHDETMINLAMKDKLTFIDQKYNYCRNRIYQNPINEKDAVILHYVGNQKKDMLKECLIIGRSPFVNKVKWDKVDFNRFTVICINYPVPNIPVDVVIARDYCVEPVLAPATEFISPNNGWNFCYPPTTETDLGFKCYTSTSAVYLAWKRDFRKAYLIGIDHKEDNKPFKHYDGVINENIAKASANATAKEYIKSFSKTMDIYQTNPTVVKQWGLPYCPLEKLYI